MGAEFWFDMVGRKKKKRIIFVALRIIYDRVPDEICILQRANLLRDVFTGKNDIFTISFIQYSYHFSNGVLVVFVSNLLS